MTAATAAVAALVVAAGEGRRLGLGPKAFVALAGEPLLVHAARALAACDELVVVVGPAEVARATALLHAALGSNVVVCAGGAQRRDSVLAGLEAVREAAVVAVHDAARPLVSPALVARTVAALVGSVRGVAPGLPVVDTLKLVDPHGRVRRTVDRKGLWAVQTPQVFLRSTLAAVHAGRDLGGTTDDLQLVEAAGGAVVVVPGERTNFKITHPEDLLLAEAVVAGRVRA